MELKLSRVQCGQGLFLGDVDIGSPLHRAESILRI